jgi:hypothetical protein
MPCSKIAVIVTMTVWMSSLGCEAQSLLSDFSLTAASSNGTPTRLALVESAPAIGGITAESSSSSSSSYSSGDGSGVILTPADKPKSRVNLGDGGRMRPFSTVAVGLRISSFGPGLEMATPLSQHLNLRSIINVIDYGHKFTADGGDYNAEIHFHSAQMSVDWFPFLHGGFHISPGIMAFNNKLAAQLKVPPGQTFELEDYELTSSLDNPLHGGATATYGRKIAPVLMAGFGNILPRNGRHFTAPFEFGVAYPGAAQISASLQGIACQPEGCADVSTDPEAQSAVVQKQNELNSDLNKFQLYPIVSMGVAYRF